MKNFIRGYITTFIGVVTMVLEIINFYGLYKFPVEVEMEWYEHLGGFIISLSFILFPKTKIEDALSKLFDYSIGYVLRKLQDNDSGEIK